MVDDCWNTITITHDDMNILDDLIDDQFWEFTNDRNRFRIIKRGDYGIQVCIWSYCEANFEWMERIVENIQNVG